MRHMRLRDKPVAVVLTLAVGVAAFITAFGLVDAALWRQPPFADAKRIVFINSTHVTPHSPLQRLRWSYPRIQLLRQYANSYTLLANYTPTTIAVTGRGDAESLRGEFVSPQYFGILDVRPARGRTLRMDEDIAAGANPVVMIGHELWVRKFNSDAGVVGQSISINRSALTIIGVMPAGFRGLSGNAQLWMPTTMAPMLTYPEYMTTDQDFINVVARLKPNVGMAAAEAEMRVLAPRVYAAVPLTEADSGQISNGIVRSVNEVRMEPRIRRSIVLLLTGVALLYLLACANVVSLLIGRSEARRRDTAVRVALGAHGWKLVRAVAGDSMTLVMLGCGIGILLAFVGSIVLPAPAELWNTRTFNSALSSFAEPRFGIRSILFGFGLTIVTLLLVAPAPLVALLRFDIGADLRAGSRGASRGIATLRRPDVRGVVIACEAMLAMVLLVAGGLMIDSFRRMRGTDLGIDPSHVLTFDLQVPDARVPVGDAPAFIARVLAAIAATPGVRSATVDGGAPVAGSASARLFIVGRPVVQEDEAPPVLRHYVGSDHFTTLGIPLLRGRAFTDRDVAGQQRVAIINELAARRFWPGKNPIGEQVWFTGSNFDRPDSAATIVGVVGDVAYQPLDQRPFQADFYTPYRQFTYASRTVFVRTLGDPSAATPAIRAALNSAAPDIPLINVQPMATLIGNSWARQRYDALLFGGFAALALLLSATGIYAVVAYSVQQRTREMGIRIALGASARHVLQTVTASGMTFPLAGLLAGVVASLALGKVIASSLYEVSPADPVVIVLTATLLLAVSLMACLVPAVRATRADPLAAMRSE